MDRLAVILGVAIGGALGSLARWMLSNEMARRWPTLFPIPTLVINLLGAFLIGVFVELSVMGLAFRGAGRVWAVTGFLGGFTTFSTFVSEVVRLADGRHPTQAVGYLLVTNAGGLLLVWLGMMIVRWWAGADR
ncbi:MAG: fluoride efflux transporter CrcB [Firmicutes bacterium]|nr:fluoride efflux transporter CrcB [Bacillota bacterium]